ncbi:MAG: hypothetical protein KKI01_10045 [Proteobacteria bacterium]|nr:hypothetical protein [Pseudomonadota bacterium]
MTNSADKTNQKQRGKPFQKGVSGNPSGRPQGSRSKATIATLSLLEGESEALTRKAVELALDGDIQALRLCLERITPTLKATSKPINARLPSSGSLADQAAAVYEAARLGKITPDEATALMNLLQGQIKIKELTDIENRLAKLEGNPLPNVSPEEFI